jgi:DNA-binding MarR family transcriptional regulator
MEFSVQADGFMTERSSQELAAWYADGEAGQEDFEAHLILLKAYNTLTTSAQRGRRLQMTVERYALLRMLYVVPERRLQMAELGRSLNVSATSITKLVNALFGLGMVNRVPHATDKRRTWVELTAEGVATVESSLPLIKASTRRRWKGLNQDEKRMIIHLLSKLLLSNQPSEVDRLMESVRPGASRSPESNGATPGTSA